MWQLTLVLCAGMALAVVNPKTPQMGWSSWNAFQYDVNQSLVENTATAFNDRGFSKAGYNYILIDAGWQSLTRAADGYQQADPAKFPDGIAALADTVHKMGLKLGIYSDAGIYDCGFYPGSFGYEEMDAAQFASWGIDYLKYDNCGGFAGNTQAPAERFLAMDYALQKTERDILYALCEWGHQFPWFWADQISDSYRMSGDIHASFAGDDASVCTTAYCLNTGYAGVSVLTMIRKMRELSGFQKPGSWADMDMMEIGNDVMTEVEEQTHFSFWAALKSPLIIGANVATMNQSSVDILTNADMIAISQDELGTAVSYIPDLSVEDQIQVWGGPLSSGKQRFTVLALNYGNATTDISIPIASVPGLSSVTNKKYTVKEVWSNKAVSPNSTIKLTGVEVGQTKVLVFSEE
ncbi:hypothetical protein SEUCBS139899_007887 [Sporothrix eucalyptigena]|uniref:Alpha-galactosidase n=1 Tax=Sporothrix eucalyptigena TaxID=1812306 RepID=A0ABP0C8U8_9PEZI